MTSALLAEISVVREIRDVDGLEVDVVRAVDANGNVLPLGMALAMLREAEAVLIRRDNLGET